MSVETLVIAKVVSEGAGALRKLYANGISCEDFPLWDEEFRWVEARLTRRKPLNRRVFRQRFPDFEWDGTPEEDITDLAAELKEERAFEAVTAIMSTLSEQLDKDNALELAGELRDHLSKVTRNFLPMSDIDLDGDVVEVIREMRQRMLLAKQGLSPGIPTGFVHLDHHWGGMMPGTFTEVIGRTGEGKSYKTMAFAWSAKKHGYRTGIFTPEFNAHQTRCRYHTLASADKEIQEAVGLKRSFRNRALMMGHGFNLKSYQHFLEYMESTPGRVHLLSGQHRNEQMSVGYIEDRVAELGLDLVVVDPIYMLKPVRYTTEGNSYQETAWTAEALHRISETYNIPIIVTNQAHEQGGSQDDAPHKSRSWGTKQINHLADHVLGVKHMSEENRMICRATKSRFGEDFRYDIRFFANTGVVKELTPVTGSYLNGHHDETEDEMQHVIENAIRGGDDA
jgi:RecA/RadA recombinase